MRGFYKGLAPYMIHVTPNICIVFLVYEHMLRMFSAEPKVEQLLPQQEQPLKETAPPKLTIRKVHPRKFEDEDDYYDSDGHEKFDVLRDIYEATEMTNDIS